MAEIDPVVVQLRADLAKYRADMVSTATRVDTALANQERSVQRLEAQIRSSSSAIATAFASVGAAFAGAFSAQALANLADSYTRLQNSLKVAGLEGQALADVQAQLVALSGRNGVAVEGLANLYGNIAQVSRELGISQAEIVAVTQAAAESLRITGTSAQAASGAILGLQQALASGTVRAEEFNQINEGGLRPLLQAAANTERFAGSVAALRIAVNDGKVSSQEFYQGILANAAGITDQASKATLTLSGSMEALRSQFVVFIGQADQSLGVTATLTEALRLLGQNIDVVAQALAVIAAVMGGRLVVSAGSAAASFLVMRTAAVGLAVSLNGVAASSALAGNAMLAAFGGPVGIAILGVGAALAYAVANSDDLSRATVALRNSNQAVVAASNASKSAIDRLATSYGAAREEALRLVQAQRQIALLAAIRTGREQIAAEQAYTTARDFARENPFATGGAGAGPSEANVRVARENARIAQQTLADIDAALRAPAPTRAAGGGAATERTRTRSARSGAPAPRAAGGGGGDGGSSGPSREEQRRRAAQDEAQFADDLGRLRVESLRLLAELNGSITARRDAELADIEESRANFARRLQLDDGLTDARREQLLAARDEADATRRAIAEQEANIALADAAARRNIAEIEGQADAAQSDYDLAETNAERLQIAYRLIDLAQRAERAELERVLATERTNSVEADIAEARLAELDAARDAARKRAEMDNASPLARFLADNSKAKLAEQAEQLIVDQLQAVRDSIADAITSQIGVRDPFISGLLRILLQEVLINPIAKALQEAGGAGGFNIGSFIGNAIGSIFGRASGGYVAPGQMVRVNEGASRGRVEGFMPTGSGKIVPLGQMNAMATGGAQAGGVVQVQVTLSEDLNARIDNRATNVAVNVTRQSAPTIIGAARDATMRDLGRERL